MKPLLSPTYEPRVKINFILVGVETPVEGIRSSTYTPLSVCLEEGSMYQLVAYDHGWLQEHVRDVLVDRFRPPNQRNTPCHVLFCSLFTIPLRIGRAIVTISLRMGRGLKTRLLMKLHLYHNYV